MRNSKSIINILDNRGDGVAPLYNKLSGNGKKLIDEVMYHCLVKGDLETDFIDKKQLSIKSGVCVGAIKTTICRLKDKGIIEKYEASKGRNSSWKFTVSEHIYKEYLITKRAYNS